MDKINVSSVDDIEEALIFEFSPAPEDVQTQADIREAIADVVKRAEAGEREIDSPYLNICVIVTD